MLPPQDSVCPLPALARHGHLPTSATIRAPPRTPSPRRRISGGASRSRGGSSAIYPVRAGEEVGLQELAMTPLDCHMPLIDKRRASVPSESVFGKGEN
jgi:hypothetical protein